MRISLERLRSEAESTGFRADVLEKAVILLEKGEIDAGILTPDASLQKRIQNHPLLQWKALNVRRNKKS